MMNDNGQNSFSSGGLSSSLIAMGKFTTANFTETTITPSPANLGSFNEKEKMAGGRRPARERTKAERSERTMAERSDRSMLSRGENVNQVKTPAQGKAQPSQAKAQPNQTKGLPGQTKTTAAQAKALLGNQGKQSPSQTKGSPSQVKGSPSQTKASPSQTKASPSQTKPSPSQAKPSPSQAKGSPSQAKGSPMHTKGSPNPTTKNSPLPSKTTSNQTKQSPNHVVINVTTDDSDTSCVHKPESEPVKAESMSVPNDDKKIVPSKTEGDPSKNSCVSESDDPSAAHPDSNGENCAEENTTASSGLTVGSSSPTSQATFSYSFENFISKGLAANKSPADASSVSPKSSGGEGPPGPLKRQR